MHRSAVAILRARWHADIVDRAVDGFTREFAALRPDHGVDVFDVPGALEMPLLARALARTGQYDAVVAVAFVVDGGIYRHDYVAQAVIDGLMRAQFETDVPVMSVSLTPHHFQPTDAHRTFFADHFLEKGTEAARATDMILARRHDVDALMRSTSPGTEA